MKILFIAQRYHTNLYYRIKALQDLGCHKIYFISLYKGGSECYDCLEPIIIGYSSIYLLFNKIISKFKKNYTKSFWELKLAIPNVKRLKQNIKEINPDVIILKDFQSLNELISLYYANKFNKKVITLTQTSKNHIRGSKILLKLYLRFIKYLGVKYFITPTKRTKKALNSIGIENISYIPFVCGTQEFNKKYFLNNQINIISIGKFVPRKDQATLLKAVNLLKNQHKIKLTLIGEKVDLVYVNKIQKYIHGNNLESIVEINFNKRYKKVLELYKKNDLFILPSYNEPAAVSIVEAMANKLPIICSDDCGTKCYIKEGKNGYIFKNKNYKDLAYKIKKVIDHKDVLINMGEKSFNMAKNNHSMQRFYLEFNKILYDKIQ